MKFYERVISDFGGYEKCKDILNQPNIDFIMNAQGLREHMLEYRRQHNIFEVGDKVVLSGGNCTLMYKLHERIGKYVYLKRPSGREYEFHIDDIRHAEPEEIKAGKRLEVNQ